MPPRDPEPDQIRVRLELSYDGTDFHGWAAQRGQRSVEEELTGGLARITRVDGLRLAVAGRTDAGVHARGQVAHVDLPRAVWRELPRRSADPPGVSLVRRLAGVLPDDVCVIAATPAPAGFDARFSALWRRYRYRIADSFTARDPIRRHDVYWTRYPLEVTLMNDALTPLLGEHDFLPFCRPREGASTVRTALDLSWARVDGLATFEVRADAFCHHMVRSLVGISLAVGQRRRPVSWPAELLAGRVRDPAVPVVAAHGLTLEEVAYPVADQVAQQRDRARRYRGEQPQPWQSPDRDV